MICHAADAAFGKLITKCAAMFVGAAAPAALFARFASINHWHRNSYRCQEVAVSGYRFPPDVTLRMRGGKRLSAFTTTTLRGRVKYVYIMYN